MVLGNVPSTNCGVTCFNGNRELQQTTHKDPPFMWVGLETKGSTKERRELSLDQIRKIPDGKAQTEVAAVSSSLDKSTVAVGPAWLVLTLSRFIDRLPSMSAGKHHGKLRPKVGN